MADEQTKPPVTPAADTDDVRARAVKAAKEIDAMTPTPTQEELDKVKAGIITGDTKGGYKTRQSKPA